MIGLNSRFIITRRKLYIEFRGPCPGAHNVSPVTDLKLGMTGEISSGFWFCLFLALCKQKCPIFIFKIMLGPRGSHDDDRVESCIEEQPPTLMCHVLHAAEDGANWIFREGEPFLLGKFSHEKLTYLPQRALRNINCLLPSLLSY